MSLQILSTDTLFLGSPETGTADCLCSRCGQVIEERCAPAIRCWRDGESGFEYRYHPHCFGMWPCCGEGDDPE